MSEALFNHRTYIPDDELEYLKQTIDGIEGQDYLAVIVMLTYSRQKDMTLEEVRDHFEKEGNKKFTPTTLKKVLDAIDVLITLDYSMIPDIDSLKSFLENPQW